MRRICTFLIVTLVIMSLSGCSLIAKARRASAPAPQMHVSAIMAEGAAETIYGLVALNPHMDTVTVGKPTPVTVIVRFDGLPAGKYTARATYEIGPAPFVLDLADYLLVEADMTMTEYKESEYKTEIDAIYEQYRSDMTNGWKSDETYSVEGYGATKTFNSTVLFTVKIGAWDEGPRTISIYLDDRLVYELPVNFVSAK